MLSFYCLFDTINFDVHLKLYRGLREMTTFYLGYLNVKKNDL